MHGAGAEPRVRRVEDVFRRSIVFVIQEIPSLTISGRSISSLYCQDHAFDMALP